VVKKFGANSFPDIFVWKSVRKSKPHGEIDDLKFPSHSKNGFFIDFWPTTECDWKCQFWRKKNFGMLLGLLTFPENISKKISIFSTILSPSKIEGWKFWGPSLTLVKIDQNEITVCRIWWPTTFPKIFVQKRPKIQYQMEKSTILNFLDIVKIKNRRWKILALGNCHRYQDSPLLPSSLLLSTPYFPMKLIHVIQRIHLALREHLDPISKMERIHILENRFAQWELRKIYLRFAQCLINDFPSFYWCTWSDFSSSPPLFFMTSICEPTPSQRHENWEWERGKNDAFWIFTIDLLHKKGLYPKLI